MALCGEPVLVAPGVDGFVEFAAVSTDLDIAVDDTDVKPAKEGLKEFSTDVVGELAVELAWFLEEVDEGECLVGSLLQSFHGAGQLLGDRPFLEGDLFEALAQFVDVERAVGSEVDQALFLCFQLLELRSKGVLLLLVGGLEIVEGPAYFVADGGNVFGVEAFCSNHAGDLVLELLDADVRHGAGATLLTSTDEVLVGATVAGVLGVDQAADSFEVVAVGAEQQTAEEMEVTPIAVPFAVACVEGLLHLEEEFLRDERGVPSWVEASLVSDDPGVIGVAQNHGELTARKWPGSPLAGGTSRQTLVFEQHLQLCH